MGWDGSGFMRYERDVSDLFHGLYYKSKILHWGLAGFREDWLGRKYKVHECKSPVVMDDKRNLFLFAFITLFISATLFRSSAVALSFPSIIAAVLFERAVTLWRGT